MEDTKKLIERYKQELMEMSRTSPRPEAEHSEAETREGTPKKASEKKKAPEVIGFVSEENKGFSEIFDKYIIDDEEISEETDCGCSEKTPESASDELSKTVEVEENDDGADDITDPEMLFGTMRSSNEEESGFVESEFSSYEDFKEHNIGSGTLEFRVFTAEQALPVKSAAVTVTVKIGKANREMFSKTADESGETEPYALPAPSKELSLLPHNHIQPFSLYDARVECSGYDTVILRDIPIFDGVQSVQRVAMIPSAESADTEVQDAE